MFCIVETVKTGGKNDPVIDRDRGLIESIVDLEDVVCHKTSEFRRSLRGYSAQRSIGFQSGSICVSVRCRQMIECVDRTL